MPRMPDIDTLIDIICVRRCGGKGVGVNMCLGYLTQMRACYVTYLNASYIIGVTVIVVVGLILRT